MTIHTHEAEHTMDNDTRLANMLRGDWRAGTGENRSTIHGKDYTYGWFADRNGKCIGHAWYCHTDDMFVLNIEGINQ
jgi:hypothetical protein